MRPLVMTSFIAEVTTNTVFKISFERRFKKNKIIYVGYGILTSEKSVETLEEPDFAFRFTRRNFFDSSVAVRISTKVADFEDIFGRLAEIIVAKVTKFERDQFVMQFSLQ